MATGSYGNPQGEVIKVGVRIPPFWPEEPALWFAQVESQFILARISTDETKYAHVVAYLEHRYIAEVKDIIANPPATDKYEKIKSELIKRLSASQEKRVKQLLMHEELGDRKPSQFLRHLQDLAGASVPKEFMTTIWSSRLPHNIQTVIASQADLGLEKLAEIADKVHEIAPATPQVAATSSSATSATDSNLAQQVAQLTKQVASLSAQLNRRDRHRPSSRHRYRSRSHSRPQRPPSDHPHCYYHFVYGKEARKCKNPCSYDAENSQGGRK